MLKYKMKTILVDDQLYAMEQFEQECCGLKEIELVGKFDNAEDALAYAGNHKVEFALMDICLPGMDGIELGRALKQINPDIIIIYVTGYSRYVVDAMKIKADYCIMKPYDKADITDALMRVKLLASRFRKRVRVVTFGRFEVYVDDNPLYFANGKGRELFAYCIHREGANISMEEAIDVLWPDRPYDERVKRLYRKAISAIQAAFEEKQVMDVFVNNRGCCYIEKKNMDCDLYRYLDGQMMQSQREKIFNSGYMEEYGWAQYCNVLLREKMQNAGNE